MDVKPKEIRIYENEEGHAPFSEWMDRQEAPLYGKLMARLERVELGNLGDHRGIGEGVFELRIDFGAGYRIYFGLDGSELVVLLIGGTKKTQQRDIDTAKHYWRNYNA
ncbi:MAG: type II toxin-antitoxin system RelE/ParE family toxin [Acidobacteriaceae bacterium]